MGMNSETVAWLLLAERQREVAEIERRRALRPAPEDEPQAERSEPARPHGLRRAIGLRLIRLGADLAHLSARELARSTD